MTFTEAAAQVLRLVGKPLHYKEITDVAIEKNLLSHVGKSPEVTMGARLAALVKKGEKENPLVRVKPGVFALREWDDATIEKGLRDRTPALERLSGQDLEIEAEPETSGAAHVSLAEFAEEGAAVPPNDAERARAELAAHATELFETEEDDDRPIFGPDAPEAEDDPARVAADGTRRRRRRRRRGGRGTEERAGGDDLPSYTVTDAPLELVDADLERLPRESREPAPVREAPAREPRVARAPRENREPRVEREPRLEREPRAPRESREAREPRDNRDAHEPRDGRDAHEPRFDREPLEGRDRDRGERNDRDRDRGDRDRGDRDRGDRDRGDRDRGDRAPLAELAGKPLADAIESLLMGFDKSRGPVSLQTLLDAADRRGRLGGDLAGSPQIVLSAVRADNARRANEGRRPRFRLLNNKLALSDWALDSDLGRAEREFYAALDRLRDASRRSLLRCLQDLPQRAIGETVVLLLEQLGYVDLLPVRRPGSHGAEVHLCGRARGASSEIRTGVVVRRDGREIGRERVTELRGALHHYGSATAGLIITTGQVLSGAREEAAATGAAPISVIDGIGLARLCEEHGVAVAGRQVRLALPDWDLLDGLRASAG
jgi:hypothetical protein